jgi:O-antigen ligase
VNLSPFILHKKLHSYSIFQISYIALFAILPFIYSESFIDPVLIPRQFFLTFFLLFIWAIIFITKKQKDLSIPVSRLSSALILCAALIVIFSFISIIYANTFSESIYVASKYGVIFLFLITTWFLLGTQLILKKDLIYGLIIFCVISLLYGIYDIVLLVVNGLDALGHSFLINSTHTNKNLFASVLVICFWALFEGIIQRWLKYVLIILSACFVLLLQSKIVAFVFACMLLALILKNLKRHITQNKTMLITGTLIGVAILLAVFLNFHKFKNLSSLHTLNIRSALWANSFEMAKENPFGVGAGQWQIFFPKYGLSEFDSPEVRNGLRIYHQPHNDFIWILCELGIQGLTAYLLIFLLTVIMLVKLIRKKNDSTAFLLLMTIFGYCLIAFFDFPLERIEHQIIVSVVLALTMNAYDSISVDQKTRNPVKYYPIYTLLLSISLIVCYYRLRGEYFTRQFIFLNKSKHAEFVIENCNKAQSLFYTIDPISMPIDWQAGLSLFSKKRFNEAQTRLEKAYRYTPYNIAVLTHLANVYEKQGNRFKAIEFYKKAIKISPFAKIHALK